MAPNDALPGPLPGGATNGTKEYYRRRIDELVDRRLLHIEHQLSELDKRTDSLSTRLNWFFGGLAVVVALANLLGPVVIRTLTGAP